MSPLSIFKRHPRDDLSAYLDGALTPLRVQRVEAHLQSCAACRDSLEALGQARATLRALSQDEAPRSFGLTPEMARQAPVQAHTRGVQPLVSGLRVASGGLAVAFVVALVAAIGAGGTRNSSSDDAGVGAPLAADVTSSAEYLVSGPAPSASMVVQDRDAAATTIASAPPTPNPTSPVQAESPTPALPLTGGGTGVGGSAGGGGSGAGSGGAAGGAGGVGGAPGSGGMGMGPSEAPVPPDATLAPDAIVAPSVTDVNQGRASATEIPKAITGLRSSASDSSGGQNVSESVGGSSDGGGVDWTLVAIVFGALLGVTVIGSIAASRLASRQA
jgi:anti-sigma factor RsiW